MDLGACPKLHTERLKTEFNEVKEKTPNDPRVNNFQTEYESNIFAFVDDCDRRIRIAHKRLEKTPEENAKTTNLVGTIESDSPPYQTDLAYPDEGNCRVRAGHSGRNGEDRAARFVVYARYFKRHSDEGFYCL